MKYKDEIFKEWYKLNFKKLPNPREYVYFIDSLDFQRYLLWYRCKELLKSTRIELEKIFKKVNIKKSEKVVEEVEK